MTKTKIQQLAILGAGGHAKVVLDIALQLRTFHSISIFDDNDSAKQILNFQMSGNSEMLLCYTQKYSDAVFIIAIGNNVIRAKHFLFLLKQEQIASNPLLHPSCVVANSTEIGKGSVLMANVVVNADARIGSNAIINTSAVVEHDCHIGNHAHISPNAIICGAANVGDYAWIGAGTVILEGRSIGKNCIVGAGAVVTEDIPDNTIAIGTPAKPIKNIAHKCN